MMQSNLPRVDVVIPFFNGSKTLAHAVSSAFNQSMSAELVIVVDDGSSKKERIWLDERFGLEPKVHIVSTTNGGQSRARNIGVRQSSADYVALLDQDDIFFPDHIETLVHASKGADLTYGDVKVLFPASNRKINSYGRKVARPISNAARDLLAQNLHVLPSAMLLKREEFLKAGGFNEDLRGFEDDDLLVRYFMARKNIVRVEAEVTLWTKHDESSSHSLHMDKSRLGYFTLIHQNYLGHFSEVESKTVDAINARFLKVMVANLLTSAGQEDWQTQVSIFAQAFELCPKRRFTPLTWILSRCGLIFTKVLGKKKGVDSAVRFTSNLLVRAYVLSKSMFLSKLR